MSRVLSKTVVISGAADRRNRFGRGRMLALGLAALAGGWAAEAHGALVTLTTSDANSTTVTSFNSAGHWSDATAPTPGNTYATGAFAIRTPNNGTSYTFGGDSLSIDTGGRLLMKATGTTQVDTVNLILNGGYADEANGPAGDTATLAGTIALNANSALGALTAEFLVVNSTISGGSALTIGGTINGGADVGTVVFNGANTYTGSTTVSTGTLRIASSGRIGSSTSTADVSVGGATSAFLDIQNPNAISDFASLKLTSGTSPRVGLAGGINETINQLFINGLVQPAGTYGSTGSGATFTRDDIFSPTGSGILTVVAPEPSTLGLALVGGLGLLARRRRIA